MTDPHSTKRNTQMATATQSNGSAASMGLEDKKLNVEEQRIIRDVVRRCTLEATRPAVASRPSTGAVAAGPTREYLSRAEAAEIVDEAIRAAEASDDETMHAYVSGHRERLIRSLAAIPKATGPGQSCLDVGCYGYMMLWAEKHLGYDRVEGVELRPDSDEKVMNRVIELGREAYEFKVHNFDISRPEWTVDSGYDTVLFFETLEHVNEDPMGIMERIAERMPRGGALVMSVPNCASYKAVRELLVGMPPWTYWFYHPDLDHEPRHAFEYTPIVFRTLVASTGFEEDQFFSLYAYSSEQEEEQVRGIAERAGMNVTHFGETMVSRSFKTSDRVRVRYPSVLYDPDRYYELAYPIIAKSLESTLHSASKAANTETVLRARVDELIYNCNLQVDEVQQRDRREESLSHKLEKLSEQLEQERRLSAPVLAENAELRARVDELLFTLDLHMERADTASRDRDAVTNRLTAERDEAAAQCTRLAEENGVLTARVDELLFACDLYLQRVDDPRYCASVIRRNYMRRFLDKAKRTARRTPIVRSVGKKPYNYLKRVVKSRR